MNPKNGLSEVNLCAAFREISTQTQRYIQDVIKVLNHHIGVNAIVSLILFGSQARNSEMEVSDCDLLIIVEEKTPESVITVLRKSLLSLEIKYHFLEYKRINLLTSILFAMQRTMGMFVSHFITKRSDFTHARFYKIFSVNRLFSTLFAPIKLVLLNVLENSVLICGQDLRGEARTQLPESHLTFDILKSLVMNLALSIFSLVLIPFKTLNPIKYTLEAIKWSANAIHYYLFRDSKCLETVLRRLIRLSPSPRKRKHMEVFYERFLDLRDTPRLDRTFMMLTPLKIINMHINALKMRFPHS